MIRYLLQVAAVVFFVGAILASFGWLLNKNLSTALGLLAFGLLCNTLAAIPDRPPPT